MSNKLEIKARIPGDKFWCNKIDNIKMPVKLTFAVFNHLRGEELVKVVWDWGDGTKGVIATNRKEAIESQEFTHIFRPKNIDHKDTLTIQVTGYTSTEAIIPPVFEITEAAHKESHIYVDPDEFKANIVQYYKTDVLTEDLGEQVYLICNRLAYAPNFVNYSYREDMIGDALIKSVEALKGKKFDPDKGNPFSYFTKIAYNAFCNRIKREKKAREALSDYQEAIYSELISEGYIPDDNFSSSSDGDYDS